MYDIKQINRVRGILSARDGTQIPKFQNPAGTIDDKKLGATTITDYIQKRLEQIKTPFTTAGEQSAAYAKILDEAKQLFPQDATSQSLLLQQNNQHGSIANNAQLWTLVAQYPQLRDALQQKMGYYHVQNKGDAINALLSPLFQTATEAINDAITQHKNRDAIAYNNVNAVFRGEAQFEDLSESEQQLYIQRLYQNPSLNQDLYNSLKEKEQKVTEDNSYKNVDQKSITASSDKQVAAGSQKTREDFQTKTQIAGTTGVYSPEFLESHGSTIESGIQYPWDQNDKLKEQTATTKKTSEVPEYISNKTENNPADQVVDGDANINWDKAREETLNKNAADIKVVNPSTGENSLQDQVNQPNKKLSAKTSTIQQIVPDAIPDQASKDKGTVQSNLDVPAPETNIDTSALDAQVEDMHKDLAQKTSTITSDIQTPTDEVNVQTRAASEVKKAEVTPTAVQQKTADGASGKATDVDVKSNTGGAAEAITVSTEGAQSKTDTEGEEGAPEGGGTPEGGKATIPEDVEIKDFTGEKIGTAATGAAKGIDAASALFVDKSKFAADSFTNSEARQTYDSVADTAMQFGPYGAAVGAGMKAFGLINDMFGKSADEFSVDTATLNQVGGSYGGSAASISEAAAKSGQKYGLFDGKKRRRVNREIAEARRQQSVMQDIAKDSSDIQGMQSFASDVGGLAYQYNIDGGYDQKYMRAAKEGGTIDFEVKLTDPLDYYKAGGSISIYKVELTDPLEYYAARGNIESFKEGGSVNSFGFILSDIMESFKEGGSLKAPEIEVIETDTNQKSVIPEGTLHKNKHHLADVGVDDSELTKKGIPVVDNSGEQQAEIELNEIIFTLEVTKELESRYKEFYEENTSPNKKDELALEAGKLLWKEILYNTDDRTGLIDTLKKGGAIKVKDGAKTPKKIPFAEWVKDINKDYLSPNYDLELAYEYLPIEDLERWKHAVNSADPEVYLNYKDPKTGEYTYHLKSIAPYGEDGYIFLKKGTETTNPEVGAETSLYWSGENGLAETHDLVYDQKAGRYFYRKKTKKYVGPANAIPDLRDINRKAKTQKHELGGVITQESLTEMIRQALLNILIHG